MKISLTGASGHIGTNLCRELLKEGHQLKVLVNLYTRSLDDLELETVHGNLLEPESIDELADGADLFIHLAASISINGAMDLIDTNYQGTLNVLRAVQKQNLKRLIHFSSIHAFSHDPLDKPLDETRPLALNDRILYNRSKAMGEKAVREAAAGGMDAVIINPTSVLGPNDFKPSLLGQALIQLHRGKLPALIPGGYDWVDVRDVVEATIAAIEKGRKGESYLLSGHFVSLAELYETLRQIKGGGKNLSILPFWLAEIGVPFLKGWARVSGTKPLYTKESVEILKTAHRNISSRKAETELGYRSRPFRKTLEETISWFLENNYLE